MTRAVFQELSQQALFESYPEAVLQNMLRNTAISYGWTYAHFHDSRKAVKDKNGEERFVGDADAAGFPDTVLVRGHRVVFVELKRGKTSKAESKLRPEQKPWRDVLSAVGGNVEYYLWAGSDFVSCGPIERALA